MKLALVVALLVSSVPLQPDVPKPQPVVDNGEFMDIFLKTSYGDLQEAMAKPPTDRRGWAIIYQRAIRVAELQNLLFFRDRPEVKDPRWGAAIVATRTAATDLANTALFGLRNLQKANYEEVRQKYVALSASCNTCHRAFAREAPTIKP
ncbi:MAG TPA: hypothetical protein VFA59_25475 [Vicinamibacterales bacterium]|nr:hypothetical protein [Vicinamibacterales bacterium]